MDGIWQLGGRSLKFVLRFTKGRTILNFCSFSLFLLRICLLQGQLQRLQLVQQPKETKLIRISCAFLCFAVQYHFHFQILLNQCLHLYVPFLAIFCHHLYFQYLMMTKMTKWLKWYSSQGRDRLKHNTWIYEVFNAMSYHTQALKLTGQHTVSERGPIVTCGYCLVDIPPRQPQVNILSWKLGIEA